MPFCPRPAEASETPAESSSVGSYPLRRRPLRDVLPLAGPEAVQMFDDNIRLKEEVKRLRQLLGKAGGNVRAYSLDLQDIANEIEDELKKGG